MSLSTLTTAPETITASNVTINGVVDFVAANSTLTSADVLTPASGTNVLNVTTTGAGATNATNSAQVSGIQTINVRASTAGQTTTLDATQAAGLTAANSNLSTGIVTVTGLTAAASAGVIGNSVAANGASNFGWGATVTAATLNVSNGVTAGAVALTGTLLATQTVNSTGAANVLTSLTLDTATTALTINSTTALTTGAITNAAGTALARVTVTGAGATTIASLGAGVTTLNASAATGALTATLGSAVTQTVTGGSGNDVITTGALVLTTGSVNGGTGTDTLDIGTNVGNANTSTLAAKYTNFETLRVNGTFDASLIAGINTIQLSGATNAITNLSATQAAAIFARADIGATTLTLATTTGTTDVLNLTLGLGTTTAAAGNAGVITATGFETINLVANGGPSATTGASRISTITGAIVDSSLTAVNLTGTAFTFTDISSSKAVAWNASALTGNGATTPVGLAIGSTGTSFVGSVITGSAFRDTVTMDSSTGITFNLGGGNDIFTTTTTLLLPSGAATDNTVNGGDGTNDQLVFTGAATATDTTFTKTTGFESLQLAGAGVVNSVTGLAAGFLSAFAGGVTVTDTAAQTGANAYSWASGLYSQNVTLTHATTYEGTAAAGNQTITTGAGNDVITVTATAWVGVAAGTGGTIAVTAGAGNDIITVSTATQLAQTTTAPVVITGGLGADQIFSTGVNITTGAGVLTTTYAIAAGDSLTTAYDSINGFDLGTAGLLPSTLDLAGTGAVTTYAATAAAGFSAAQLTVAVTAVTGLVVFAGTSASTLTLAQKIAAVQSVVVANNNDLALFTDGSNSYVFENNTTADTLVELVGVTATNIITANANTAGSVLVL